MLTLDNIYKASYVLKEVIRHTDLIHAPAINPESEIYLKPENLQVTGSFKVRGAYYKISQLSDEEKTKGVIACSAGNHAQGVALAATHSGIKSLICLPEGAPISKVEATRRLGADICLVKGVYDDMPCNSATKKDIHSYIPSTTNWSLPDKALSDWNCSNSCPTWKSSSSPSEAEA